MNYCNTCMFIKIHWLLGQSTLDTCMFQSQVHWDNWLVKQSRVSLNLTLVRFAINIFCVPVGHDSTYNISLLVTVSTRFLSWLQRIKNTYQAIFPKYISFVLKFFKSLLFYWNIWILKKNIRISRKNIFFSFFRKCH